MEYSESLIYVNSSGEWAILSDEGTRPMWELRNRSGFTAPDIELITQKYVNGINKVVGRIILPRTIRMNFVLVGETTVERDQLFAELVEKLMNTDKGENGKLYVRTTSGQTYVLNCAYASGLNITDEYRKFHRFTLEFYAEDPYFYSDDVTAEISFGGSGIITLSDTLTLGGWALGWGAISGSGAVINPFTRALDPVFRISGARTDIMIRQTATGKVIQFDGLMMTGSDVIVIDTRDRYKTAYIQHADGTRDSILGNMDWNNPDLSMPMLAGGNNIEVESVGIGSPLEVTLALSYLSA